MYVVNYILIRKYGYNLLLNSVNTFRKLNNQKQ